MFRAESLLNTPLFVGFPGYVSKLWLAHDEHRRYRGIYEWDDPAARRGLRPRPLAGTRLVSVRGSIHHVVLPGLHRDELLGDPARHGGGNGAAQWWRPVAVT